MDRRSFLKTAAAGTAFAAVSGCTDLSGEPPGVTIRSNNASGRAYPAALDRLVEYVEQQLAENGLPGLAFCLVDAEGFDAIGTFGWANVDSRIPVNDSHLFQIGSISKSFAALCAYRLADEGKVELGAPLSRYLPDLPLPEEPIRVQQLLSHTAGLPRSAPVFPNVPDRRLWTGFTPGSKFSYSNTGFDLIGLLVEKVSGKPYPLALRELVIEPLKISGVREVIQASDREYYAVGYSPADASGSNMVGVPLKPTAWADTGGAAGNIGASAAAMTAYLRYLIKLGRGQGSPILSSEMAKRFSTVVEPAAAQEEGGGYASGLQVIDVDGHAALHHLGGMPGFNSSMTVDPVTGVGCFVCANAYIGGYSIGSISTYACKLLRHAIEGGASPTSAVDNLGEQADTTEEYTGVYVGPDGDRFELVVESEHLIVTANGHTGRMQSVGQDSYLSNHIRFGSHFFDFERDGGAVIAVWYGGTLYGRGGAVPQPTVAPHLDSLQGTYVSSDFWSGERRSVYARGDHLVIENIPIYRVHNTMHYEGDYWRPESTKSPCEQVRFADVIDGVPQRLNYSGRDLGRFNHI